MDTTKPLVNALSGAEVSVQNLVVLMRTLIIQANEEAPLTPQSGLTVDEAQAEVITNIELALRHLEDAASRLAEAGLAWGPVATNSTVDTSTDTSDAEEEQAA